MYAKVLKIINKWGRDIEIEVDGVVVHRGKAFVQPLRYKNKLYLEAAPTLIGLRDMTHYLFIGGPEFALKRGDLSCLVKTEDAVMTTVMTSLIYLGPKPLYRWAVLRAASGGTDE